MKQGRVTTYRALASLPVIVARHVIVALRAVVALPLIVALRAVVALPVIVAPSVIIALNAHVATARAAPSDSVAASERGADPVVDRAADPGVERTTDRVLAAAESVIDRAFGYQIGDLILQRIVTRAPADGFDPALLTEPGIVNSWLTLRRVAIAREGDTRLIRLEYQVTSANPEVTLIFLPPVVLQSGGQTLARVDAQPVTVSPIIGTQPFQRSGLGDLRLDRRDTPPPTGALQRRLVTLLVLLLGLSAALWWRYRRRLERDGPPPFAQARHELKQLLRSGGAAIRDEPAAAYRILHRAFDRSAGRSLFLEDVEAFVEQRPSFAAARNEIIEFFDSSRAIFFAARSRPALDPGDLLALAARLANLERRP